MVYHADRFTESITERSLTGNKREKSSGVEHHLSIIATKLTYKTAVVYIFKVRDIPGVHLYTKLKTIYSKLSEPFHEHTVSFVTSDLLVDTTDGSMGLWAVLYVRLCCITMAAYKTVFETYIGTISLSREAGEIRLRREIKEGSMAEGKSKDLGKQPEATDQSD